jgi:hypothetical protein
VLEATVLCRGRPEAMLGPAMPRWKRLEVTLVLFGILWEHPSERWDSTGNLLGLE